ncbi:glycosyltransferase family 4 protein [Lacisediminihabitans changchengi]|uniref:glycosyltransferase family 4 protein n=1 Tax=Lacisediminihabitans changchengi TaxID=2787634 RepID=UPI001F3F2190|nr:glycosyltransferase family 4 protein [Lacisediminihabitans changchengi]
MASTVHSSLTHPDFEIFDASSIGLRESEQWADVIVFQGHLLATHKWLKDSEKIIVADIYDPMHLEQLEQGKDRSWSDRVSLGLDVVTVLNDQILRADFMVCASDKQRDFWMGQLAGMGRINPATYDQDASLRSLLDVVPFGLDATPPVQRRHAIKGTIPGISAEDKVILWGGGIYNWFDPLTLIRAVAELHKRRPNVRLFFLGVKHPNPNVPTMQMSYDAQNLAKELGLLGSVVFFNEGWVPYDERADYILDADVGVSTHLDHLETAFSFRTRILDYLWGSLPIVSTAGDTFAEIIEHHELGRVVAPQDVAGLESALESVLFDDVEHAATVDRVKSFAATMTWERVLQPLVTYCLTGERAPDLARKMILAGLDKQISLQTRVDGLEQSFSWRITAPVRAVTGLFRRFRG